MAEQTLKPVKQRNHVYDAIRGFLLFVIIIKHLMCALGHCAYGTPEGTFAVILEMVSLQIFFILSGIFSKNVDRARESSVKALLWPFVVSIFLFVGLIYLTTGELEFFEFGDQPFGMWFLIVLFAFRFLLKYLVKIPHIFGISVALLFISGLFEGLSVDFYAFSRMITYLWSFLLGYYMTMEQVEKIRKLKIWWVIILAAVLIGVTYYINMGYGALYDRVFQIKASYESLEVTAWEGMLLRLLGMAASVGWFVVLVNIFSTKKYFFAWIGMATMPMYIFHLIVRELMVDLGPGFGLFEFPDNDLLLWLYVIAIAVAISAFSACKVGQAIYDFIFSYSYDGFVFVMKKIVCGVFGLLEIPFKAIGKALSKPEEK